MRVNGQTVTNAIYTSQALKFGLSVFETIRCQEGELRNLDAHLKRMRSGAAYMGIELPEDLELERILSIEAAQTQASVCAIRMQAYACEDRTVVLTHTSRLPYKRSQYLTGLSVTVSEIKRYSGNPLLRFKTAQYALNALERQKAIQKGFDEVLFLNEQDLLCEGAISNVFLVSEGILYTPDLGAGVLPGTMRAEVIEAARKRDVPLKVQTLCMEDLLRAEDVFICNALMGIMPVRAVDHIQYEISSIQQGLRDACMEDWLIPE